MLLLLLLTLTLTLTLSYISLRRRSSFSDLCISNNEVQDEYKSPLSQRWYREKQRHISPNLKKVYNTNWEKYGIELEYGKKINLSEIASTISQPYTILDIGFGTGDSIVGMSAQSSDILFIGCEIYRAGMNTKCFSQ
jgi:tRNA G46 methylase TrmB